jgi:O-antigen ligase
VLWTYVAAWVRGGNPGPVVATLVAALGGFVITRVLANDFGWAVCGAVAVLIALAASAFVSDLGADGPLMGPLGYTNASAALYLQGTVAASMAAVAAPNRALRVVGAVLAAALAVETVVAGSNAGSLLLLLPIAALLVRKDTAVRRLIGVFLGVFLLAFMFTFIIGATWGDGRSGFSRVIEESLSARRPELWHDAIALTSQHPLVGVGPGRFREESPVAAQDAGSSWAHNEFLQQGAEGGLPAMFLALSMFVWGFIRLLSIAPGQMAGLAAASLASLGIQACIDYVLHFPVLPIAVAVLVGAAVGSGTRPMAARPREG